MPTSHYCQIPDVISTAIEINPKRILEVGIGCGKYGALLREYLTVWDHYFEPFDMSKVWIEGVEIHALYASSPMWRCYDSIHRGDIRTFPWGGRRFDMVLMVDVLEHFEFEEGIALLHELLEHAETLLVSVPACFIETLEVWDNPHEIHRAEYTPTLLHKAGFTVEVKREIDSFVMILRK